MKQKFARGMAWTKPMLAVLFALDSVAQAHPGHGLFDRGAAHIATSPFHLAMLACASATLFLAARFARAPLARTLCRVGATTCLCLAVLAPVGPGR